MDSVDAVVVGAGVVGLAVARTLAARGFETLVLERETAIGTGISSRNSEVIHAGLYYAAGSLKARLCVEGRERLYAYCESHGVDHQRLGKLVVATSIEQAAELDALCARALANGVSDVVRLDARAAQAMEPELACHGAMWSPSTGIVDAHGLMLALQGDIERAGGAIALASPVSSIALQRDAHVLQVGGAQPMALRTRLLVNAAGLGAVPLARCMQGLDPAHVPRAYRCKGSYFSLAMASPFRRLVYPMPQDAWLGVHLTLDLGGQARFGPDFEWLGEEEGHPLDYRVDAARAEGFYADVRRYWPGLPDGALVPAYSGMRPKIHGPDEPAPDFLLQGPAMHGVPGLLNGFGIESPGLTSCLALADEVVARLGLPGG
jgi:L-2-hydroxyglutarate oxidase LhgO